MLENSKSWGFETTFAHIIDSEVIMCTQPKVLNYTSQKINKARKYATYDLRNTEGQNF